VTTLKHEVLDKFLYEKLLVIQERPWFANMANFKASGPIPEDFDWHQRKKFFKDVSHCMWDDPYLFKIGADNLLRICVTREKAKNII